MSRLLRFPSTAQPTKYLNAKNGLDRPRGMRVAAGLGQRTAKMHDVHGGGRCERPNISARTPKALECSNLMLGYTRFLLGIFPSGGQSTHARLIVLPSPRPQRLLHDGRSRADRLRNPGMASTRRQRLLGHRGFVNIKKYVVRSCKDG